MIYAEGGRAICAMTDKGQPGQSQDRAVFSWSKSEGCWKGELNGGWWWNPDQGHRVLEDSSDDESSDAPNAKRSGPMIAAYSQPKTGRYPEERTDDEMLTISCPLRS